MKRSRCKIKLCRLFCCLGNMLSGAFWMQSGNLGKGDALAECVSRASILAAQLCDGIDQIDITLVIASSDSAMAVDGLILSSRASLQDAAV